MNLYSNYIYRTLHLEKFLNLEAMITLALDDNDYSIDNFGLKLNSNTTHVFLSGDPAMIGAPKKKGRWEYEHSISGIIPILTSYGFEVSTRFKPGNVEYECYW